ncbi:MAG TPA: isoaspartyl peptidase/L-asparaginase, partial [Pyrinomonadaceae bacterium]|nr:isoaspartyl peptidase/L-asparaginase [Pyrinomonadaceae bacterium]
MSKIALAIHGGAGTILRSTMTAELEQEYRAGLENALTVGWGILAKGGSALEAVESTVCTLEDFHLFNAGRGSVFTHDGKNEMDASIMDGRTLDAGAVAFLRNVKNPIKLARLVMERTPHILLAADGANQFAKEMHVEFAPDEYFFTEHRWQQLLQARQEGIVQLDHTAEETGLLGNGERGMRNAESGASTSESGVQTADTPTERIPNSAFRVPHSKGTVGAVACDTDGNLAAATSTGGMTNKKFGRVGDTALIGAGTYADNATCAISCTGHGEYFMSGVT